MKTDNHTTEVIFRKWKGSIIALFPYLIADNSGNVESYMHVGQHSAADYTGIINSSKPAKKEDYKGLKYELTNIGYNLVIVTKRTYAKYLESFNKIR